MNASIIPPARPAGIRRPPPGANRTPAALTTLGIRVVLSGVFLFAGGIKLADVQAFQAIIAAFGLVPDAWLVPVAVGLPLLEIAAAVGLLLEVRGSLTAIALLIVLFCAILGYGIHMGLDIDCGCFGPEDPESRAFSGLRGALVRDLAMLAGVAFLFGYRRWRCHARQQAREPAPNPVLMEDAAS
jgi:hypothetical protein